MSEIFEPSSPPQPETRHAYHPVGDSCFRIDTGQSSILIDPFLTGNPTFEDSGPHGAGRGQKALPCGADPMAMRITPGVCRRHLQGNDRTPLIAVYGLAVHMASLGVENI